MKALYISYDGMTDPLGRSQVLPYLQGLAARGHELTLLSCEKAERSADEAAVREICDQAGIDWQPKGATLTANLKREAPQRAEVIRLVLDRYGEDIQDIQIDEANIEQVVRSIYAAGA